MFSLRMRQDDRSLSEEVEEKGRFGLVWAPKTLRMVFTQELRGSRGSSGTLEFSAQSSRPLYRKVPSLHLFPVRRRLSLPLVD